MADWPIVAPDAPLCPLIGFDGDAPPPHAREAQSETQTWTVARGGQQACGAEARFCSEGEAAGVPRSRRGTVLWGHGRSLCGVGAASGGGEEPVAASPEPAAAA